MTTQEIIAARAAKNVASLDTATRASALEGTLKKLYAMKGYSLADAEAEVGIAVQELNTRLVIRWPYLTMGEVLLALEAGICGEYTSDKRLSVANYITWLNAYAKSDERREAMETLSRQKPKPKGLLSKANIQAMNERAIVDGVKKAWQSFQETGEIGITADGWAAAMCEWLMFKGKLNPSPQTLAEVSRKYTNEWGKKRALLEMYFRSLKQRGVILTL